MEILELVELHIDNLKDWGHNGYITDKKYRANVVDNKSTICFEFTEIDKNFTKAWETSPIDISDLNEIIKKGHSFGAYQDSKLIGIAICDARDWNNTLYLENLLISEKYRGQGVGQKLIQAVISQYISHGFRLIELETQNTNVPAINFYKKQGFKITVTNLKLYNNCTEEFALYMSYE